jgi:phospholipid transport system substrate-binding protein
MRRTIAVAAAAALWLGLAGLATAGVPTEQVRGAIDRILQTVQDQSLQGPAKADERRQRIRDVADQVFDWQETAKRALARHWQARSAQERSEFAKLFADLVERSYVGKIEAYSGEKIEYLGDSIDGDTATVRTKLVTRANTEIPIEYRLLKEGDRWRVYDVVIENVSLVGNYRSQFNRIIQQSGYPALVQKLRTKQEELVSVNGSPAPKP